MLRTFPFSEIHNWYKNNGRHTLPWRNYHFDEKQLGYRVWLAEIMLQQTQVERVTEYFEKIIHAYPTVEALANTDYDTFFPYYKGLGYYSRARNMLKAAQQIVNCHEGYFPNDTKQLESIAGIGPYTAQAIRAFAYNEATLSFDTNLEKIFSRYFFGDKLRKLSKEEKSEILLDFKKSGISGRDINNALMDFGSRVSLNSQVHIDWDNYPLTSCIFYKNRGKTESIPTKKKSNFPSKEAVIIAILHENHKVYFSEKKVFSPFIIGKNSSNPRAITQNFFKNQFGLEVSVRPPEIKSYNNREVPYMLCYCQIQTGEHNFSRHLGIQVRGFEESLINDLEIV